MLEDRRVIEIIQIEPEHYTYVSSWLVSDRKSRQRWEDIARALKLSADEISAVTSASPDNIQSQIEETFKILRERHCLTFNNLVGSLSVEGCHEAASKFYNCTVKRTMVYIVFRIPNI